MESKLIDRPGAEVPAGFRRHSPGPIARRAIAGSLATAAALGIVTTGTAAGSSPPTPAEAEATLEAASAALAPGEASEPAVDPTVALIELAEALPVLEGADRRRARALLARPTDGSPNGYRAPAGDVHSWPAPAGAFCITWVSSTSDAPDVESDENLNGVPDYVEEIAAEAAHSQAVQVGELGWRAPVPSERSECADPARADIYLRELGSDGIFGYMATDPGQGSKRRRAGYLVLDNDYALSQFPGFAEPLDAAKVTLAHELNHLLQVAYSARQDAWLFEATATWAEERTYPALDDWLRYVPAFARNPGVPLTAAFGAGGLKPYGSAVWNHWLDRRYGPAVVRDAWAASALTSPRDFAVGSYQRSIAGAGGPSFPVEFVRFAAASAEWRASRLPDASRYPDVRRSGRIGRGQLREFRLHHTGYRLLDVKAPGGRAIRLRATAPKGLRFGVALVARRGGPVRGRVVRRIRFERRGGTVSVSLRRPGRFSRVTAAVVNADARASGRLAGDWAYLRDRQRVEVRVANR